MRRPFAIAFAVRPKRVSKLPFRKPQLFRAAVSAFSVEHSIMRYQALESIGMAQDPVDHVAAIARAQRALAFFVDEWIRLLRVVKAVHQIDVRFAAPILVHAIHKSLPVTRRSPRIDHDDHVTTGGKELGVPAIRPFVAPLALWSAVDQE